MLNMNLIFITEVLLLESMIGLAAGFANYYSSNRAIYPICDSNTGHLSDLLCLRVATFFEPKALDRFFHPIGNLKSQISGAISPFIPNISDLSPSNFPALIAGGEKICKLRAAATQETSQALSIASEKYNEIISDCSLNHWNKTLFSNVFAEEVIFRVGIQKIALISLSKILPKPLGNFLAHRATRIVITSFLFAFWHRREDSGGVITQFIGGGLVNGFLFEQYGLLAATISHCASNLFHIQNQKIWCERLIAQFQADQNKLLQLTNK